MKNLCIGLALLLGMGAIASAQGTSAKPPSQQIAPTIVKNVISVPLVFLAIDKHHRFYAGLKKSQIRIYDNNQPQQIQQFVAEGNLPLRIVLLIDISNSINARWGFEQRAATDFLQSVLVKGRDKAMVVGFDTSLHIEQKYTDNFQNLADAIEEMRPSGGTALYDAVFKSAHNDFTGLATGSEHRNVIVIISDGADDQSRYSRDEAIEMAQNVGAVIYTIGTESTGEDAESDNVLRKFASQTGGRSYFPPQASDLEAAFRSIENELRHQYVVAYSPNNFVPNGAFHAVRIQVLVKGVTARTRPGYFAQPTGSEP
jgi:Ca-activated chloride channel family protein